MNSVIPETMTFKEIEKIFYEFGCDIAKTLMENVFTMLDKEICDTRDKTKFRHKGQRKTTMKTLMGEVSIERTLYRKVSDNGEKEYVFLLDKELGLDKIGNISPNLAEKMAGHICEMSFREVAKVVSDLTNQTISHQGVWNVVQTIGERQIEAEKSLMDDFNDGFLNGKRKVPVLFEEADGVWIPIQKRGEKKKTKKKKELKVGVVYEGWKKRHPASKEYKTIEKIAFAGFMDSEKFKCLKDSHIAAKYEVDSITHRILNGDGATWIREGHDTATDIIQLDPFHIKRGIIRNVQDKEARRFIAENLKKGHCDKALEKIEALKYECGGEESQIKKLTALETYIKNNESEVMMYKDRMNLQIPEPPEGIEYRTLGTMESNVAIFASRMKGGKSWSDKGAEHIAKIITLKAGKEFDAKINALVSGKVSKKIEERFAEEIKNVNHVVSSRVKKAVYPLHRGEIPFSNCSVTNGRKAIRKMFDLKSFTEMTYR